MKHDDQCELRQPRRVECLCGSRACPLCDGCRSGQHLKHRASDRDCACPTCEETA